MKISVCMIVKNEEENLRQTLPNWREAGVELILVDTGSTDETLKVAAEFGAKIFNFHWINDYSAARNYSLEQATGDWVIWSDADEYWTSEDLEKLKKILSDSRAEAYDVVLYESPWGKTLKTGGYWRTKIFRRGHGTHFIRAINEQLVNDRGVPIKGEESGIPVYHWGKFISPEKLRAKKERYIEQYSAALRLSPNDHYYRIMLARTYKDLGRLPEALAEYQRVVESEGPTKLVIESLESIAKIFLQQQDYEKAVGVAELLLEMVPDNVAGKTVLASVAMVLEQYDEAITLLTEILQTKLPEGIDKSKEFRQMPAELLGMVYERKGEKERAAEYFALAQRLEEQE